jgi:hypothetical protein
MQPANRSANEKVTVCDDRGLPVFTLLRYGGRNAYRS